MDNLVYQKNKKLSTDFVEHFEKIKKLQKNDIKSLIKTLIKLLK